MNRAFKRTYLIDQYESFIWTERFSAMGDFQLHTLPTAKMKSILKRGVYLNIQESDRLMVIDSVSITEDAEGAKKMVVSGKDLTSLLLYRALGSNGTNNSWIDNGTVAQIAIRMVNAICVNGTGVSPLDVIPELSTQNATTVTEVIDVDIPKKTLYQAVTELVEPEDLGIKVELKPTSPRLRFVIYQGVDRKNVVFSSTLDNLTEENYLYSDENYRNIAYVYAQDEYKLEIVTAPGVSASISGLDRRVMFVDASDINLADVTDADLIKQMRVRGKEALAENRRIALFDGKLTNINPFKYRRDYFLGDFVHMMDEEGMKKKTMISEYIWASDAEGDRSYPTFAEPPLTP